MTVAEIADEEERHLQILQTNLSQILKLTYSFQLIIIVPLPTAVGRRVAGQAEGQQITRVTEITALTKLAKNNTAGKDLKRPENLKLKTCGIIDKSF